jgi:hypothetical protein
MKSITGRLTSNATQLSREQFVSRIELIYMHLGTAICTFLGTVQSSIEYASFDKLQVLSTLSFNHPPR